ncbi:2'-5' RNA ligase family protein [Brevundimonas staleyi]|uniref:2'-5' RNA ligase family protein n=1 Tax=Brevundimonas staleyi TaxID=74326 RepID=A0ABW0FTA6_9CAUL
MLHLTLCKIGHYGWEGSVIQTALEIGDRVAGQTSTVSLTKLMHFRNSDAVVLAADVTPRPLFDLREALALELRRQFFKPGSGFKPHATFVYEKRFEVPEALLPRPILVPVEAFELISSPPRETRHKTLRVWPLGQNA